MLAGYTLAQQTSDPREAMRAAMEASIAKQRESVRRQAESAVAVRGAPEQEWYTTPWPRSAAWIRPMVPVIPIAQSSYALPCLQLPSAALEPMIERAAGREGLSPSLLSAVIRKESAGYPCAVSDKGAMGLMQLMPATAAGLGVADPLDPGQNLDAGARFLSGLLSRYQGNLSLALAAYNAGPGAVDRNGGIPPYRETRNYVRDILNTIRVGTEPRP
jgi:soluble lytic murein transglycosylase-like protein